MAERADLDLFEEFCRVARDNGLARATLGGMTLEFAPVVPDLPMHDPLPPLTNDGPPVEPPTDPLPMGYRKALGKRPVPKFRHKED